MRLTNNCGFGAATPLSLKATITVLPVDELLVIESCPLALPVAVGANCTCNLMDWVGFSVAGKLPPTIVKPVPVSTAELTVTGEVPVDVSVSVCAVVVFTVTLPKLDSLSSSTTAGLGPLPLSHSKPLPPYFRSRSCC